MNSSPASRAISSWGCLGEGDEILTINGISVNTMSRLECVKNLKESDVQIKLFVRHGTGKIEMPDKVLGRSNSLKKPPTPPQAPPRKLLRRNSSNPEPGTVTYPIATEEDLFNIPPPADFYLNTVDDFGKGFESDDTGSTISTVIDRFISDTSEQRLTHSRELEKVLKPFTMLEKEFNIQSENGFHKHDDQKMNKDVIKLDINNYENVKIVEQGEKQNNYENVEMKIPMTDLNSYENILFDQVKPAKITVNAAPVPKPRQQAPTVEPRKRTKLPSQKNMYVQNADQSTTGDFFDNTVHEYKTIENWLQETDAAEDTVPEEDLNGEVLPRCVEFLPKDTRHMSRVVVKQCIKITNSGAEMYNSSSDEEQEERKDQIYEVVGSECNVDNAELASEMLDGSGSGPTEAYFNGFQWTNHALGLPTIGEVEEELSSIEHQPG